MIYSFTQKISQLNNCLYLKNKFFNKFIALQKYFIQKSICYDFYVLVLKSGFD